MTSYWECVTINDVLDRTHLMKFFSMKKSRLALMLYRRPRAQYLLLQFIHSVVLTLIIFIAYSIDIAEAHKTAL